MLLLRSILRRSLGEFLGEITGESLGETDFLAVLDFSCCNRFSRKDFTRSSFSQGFGQCGLSTSGTAKVSGLVVCWAIFPVNFVQLATIQGNVVAWPPPRDSLARSAGKVGTRVAPAAVSCSAACLSLSGRRAGRRRGERAPRRKPAERHPPLPSRRQRSLPSSRGKGRWREATSTLLSALQSSLLNCWN